MTCEHCRDLLTDYHFRELPAALMKEVREHLDQCPGCRAELQRLAALTADVAGVLGVEPLSEEEIRDTVRKAGALPTPKRSLHAWVWLPAAAVLLVGFLVMSVARYGERNKTAPQVPAAEDRLEAKKDAAPPAPAALGERKKQETGMAFEERLPLQADGEGSSPGQGNESSGRPSKTAGIAGMESQSGAKERPAELEEAAGIPHAPEPVVRDDEKRRMDQLQPAPPAAPPAQEGMQKLSTASGGEAAKSQPAAAPSGVYAQDKDESLAAEERPRAVSKEKALEESDTFRAQGQLSGVGGTQKASSYETTKDYLKKGLLPPPESIRVEDFTEKFRPPYQEEVRHIAEMLARILKGGVQVQASKADYQSFLDYVDRQKPGLKIDPRVDELIWMIETAAKIRQGASASAGTGRDGFVPEPQP